MTSTQAGAVRPGDIPTRETETRHHPEGKTCWHFYYYSMTCDDYDNLRARAAGHCEICGIAEEDTPRGALVIDHFHGYRAGFIRGLICDKCNAGVMACHDGMKIWGANRRWQAKAVEYERNSWEKPSELALADMSFRVELFRQSDPRYVDAYRLYRKSIEVETPPLEPKPARISLAGDAEAIAARLRKHLTCEQIAQLATLLAAERSLSAA